MKGIQKISVVTENQPKFLQKWIKGIPKPYPKGGERRIHVQKGDVKLGKHSCCSTDASSWILQCERKKDGRRREKGLLVRIREN